MGKHTLRVEETIGTAYSMCDRILRSLAMRFMLIKISDLDVFTLDATDQSAVDERVNEIIGRSLDRAAAGGLYNQIPFSSPM